MKQISMYSTRLQLVRKVEENIVAMLFLAKFSMFCYVVMVMLLLTLDNIPFSKASHNFHGITLFLAVLVAVFFISELSLGFCRLKMEVGGTTGKTNREIIKLYAGLYLLDMKAASTVAVITGAVLFSLECELSVYLMVIFLAISVLQIVQFMTMTTNSGAAAPPDD